MTDKPLYRTTLSAKARRGLILNAVASSMLALLSLALWLMNGSLLQAFIFCIMGPVAVVVIAILLRSKNPLVIYDDRVVLNSLVRTTVPFANIDGIGTHPKRGSPSLTYRDDDAGHSGEMLIHWRFIREPQDEVIARINSAREAASV